MNWVELFTIISRVFAVLVTACFAYQAVYLFLPFFVKKKPHKPAVRNRYAILVAARNEELVLPYLLDSLHAQDYPRELLSVFVVADNCTDRTAEVARAHGATVFSRTNTEKVGKGYAIRYLLEQIEAETGFDCYDAFLMFDADNVLEPDYITQINRLCSDGYAAFCGYRNTKNFGGNWLSAGHGMMFLHESCHLNQSRMLLGVGCMVGGTGFGFTRELLRQCGGWRFFALTEDLEFNAWCAANGVRVGYCHDAILYDEQPERLRISWRQRTRWLQGGIQVSVRTVRSLLRGMRKGGWTTWSCFEVMTLALWGYCLGISGGALAFLSAILSAGWRGLWVTVLMGVISALLSMFAMGALTLLTEWKRIRATKKEKLRALFAFPLYMLSFVPIAVTAIFRKFTWPPIEHTAAISAEALRK